MDLQGQTRSLRNVSRIMGRLKNEIALALFLSVGDISVNNNGVVPLIFILIVVKNSKK